MITNKVAVVTGANKGLGFAIVKILCEKYDGKVYLTSRDENRGNTACEELKNLNLKAIYHQLDITDNESIKTFLKHIEVNNEEVEILINNAGILFLKSSEPKIYQAEHTIFVNFTSLVNFTEAIIPYLKNGAKVVNISSSSGHLSRIPSKELREKFSSQDLTLEELKNLTNSYIVDVKKCEDINKGWGDNPYVVSKVAVNAYTFMLQRSLSSKAVREVIDRCAPLVAVGINGPAASASNRYTLYKCLHNLVNSLPCLPCITVNCVHPGYVMSDMTYGAGSITPEDAAKLPVFLALEATTGGRYVWHNGRDVPWDGEDPRRHIDGKNV